ncbi:chorismate mutase [Listeria immobilis]|uniref:Chorismate mutase n=1 Tax=Listeria immobilis TaxID=2713502 RepID=A0ABR6T083_9LIST|nr:chorismate mutase [Listeria immobilis]MBC1484135.1 chorismate mutase [Listeria immobilis]MBC1508101.1 chorismate mutase [Listeria immobilis]MBC1511043.1 chorismate mutase [Listeria immobilis]MBC1517123.1 chorismate mutase [Listeria immobilis]MBC6304437.1 chorismate mutase [Listeria immobilis]
MDTIKEHRKLINELDFRLIENIKERSMIVQSIGKIKLDKKINIMQEDRVSELLKDRKAFAEKLQIDGEFIEDIFSLIVSYSCKLEEEIFETGMESE